MRAPLALLLLLPGAASARPAVQVAPAARHDVSAPLWLLPQRAPVQHEEHAPRPFRKLQAPASPAPRDPVLQARPALAAQPPVVTTYEGVGQGFSGPAGTFSVAGAPPDSDGDVGPRDYVSLVNSGFAVLDKTTGKARFGPVATNTLFSGFGGQCEAQDDGDGVVLYDPLADRWLLTWFAVSAPDPLYYQCVAVSATGDPTGAWYRYAFSYSEFNDYGKFGVWPDAYYATYNSFDKSGAFVGARVCAFDRESMLSGAPATQQCVQLTPDFGGLLPADLDGARPPPAGSPGFILGFGSDQSGNGTSLQLWKYHLDWSTPANSALSSERDLPVAPFTQACADLQSQGACIVQPRDVHGNTQPLDALADRLMFRLAYRNFGDHEALVVTHTVVAGASTGVRWYEVRDPNGAAAVYQQGTFAPDAKFRWLGSAALDGAGDIALGYSVSSTDTAPSIGYSGRLAGDAPGTLALGEGQLFAGTGAQIGSTVQGPLTRWGDYGNLSVDPLDDCSFWYVGEYLVTSDIFNWHTRIGTFRFPSCAAPANDFSLSVAPGTASVQGGGESVSVAVQSAVLSGTAEAVTLQADALPPKVSAVFAPATIQAGQSATLTLTAAAGARALSSTPFTVIGVSPSAAHLAGSSLAVVQNDFSLVVAPGQQGIPAGDSAAFQVQTAAVAGSAETIALSISGLPPGVTASFAPASITTGGTAGGTSTLTLSVGAQAPGGTSNLAVTGTAPSVSHTAFVQLSVPFDFSVSVSPAQIALSSGSSATATVQTTALSGGGQLLALSAVSLPPGVQASFAPATVAAGGASTITLTAALGAAPGTSSFVVRAVGSSTKDTKVPVTVSSNEFSLSVAPAKATVVAGGSATFTISTASVSGLPEQVTLSVGGLPPNVLATFAPQVVVAGASSTLTLAAQGNVGAGSGDLLIGGEAPSGLHSVPASLTTFSQPLTNITSPNNAAVVSGIIPVVVTATVSPGTALKSLQLLVDGAATGSLATTSPAQLAFDTSTVANGPHTLSVQAADLAGGATLSPRTVVVDVENHASGGCSSAAGAGATFEALGFLGLFALVRARSRRRA